MNITHLGHESWLIDNNGQTVLIDPILCSEFGTNKTIKFEFNPKTIISKEIYSNVDSVILTTEHFQHFDLKSISKLNKNIKVYIPNYFSEAAKVCLNELGVSFEVIKINREKNINNFSFKYISSDKKASIWDSRVVNLVLSYDGLTCRDWVFFQSDTKIQSNLSLYMPDDWSKVPKAVFLTSNYKAWDKNGYSATDNYIADEFTKIKSTEYMSLLSSIIPTEVDPLNLANYYVIAGGGYCLVNNKKPHPKVDNEVIGQDLVKFLAKSTSLSIAKAGNKYNFDADEVEVTKDNRIEVKSSEPDVTVDDPFNMSTEFIETQESHSLENLKLIRDSLGELSKVILFSNTGERLLFTSDYLGKSCGPKRFILSIIGEIKCYNYVFDFSVGMFVETYEDCEQFIANYPMGLKINYSVYLALIKGEITVAEACFSGVLQWHVGSTEESPIALLYTAYSEYFNNKISAKKYNYIKKNLQLDDNSG